MDTSGELRIFLEKWRAAFNKFRWAYWEGPAAHLELQRTGLLSRVLCQEKSDYGSCFEHPIAEHAIEAFCAELHSYRDRVGKIRDTTEVENEYAQMLASFVQKIHARAKRCRSRFPGHSKRLARFVKVLENEQERLRHDQERRWRLPRSIAIEKLLTRRAPVQERELDGWLQTRLGIHFRTSLPVESGVSLRTIARLVVLFLVCAEMAVVQAGTTVMLLHSNKPVSVGGILSKLRKANIDRLSKGKRRKPKTGKP
jgi:hypothetical protein